MYPKLLELLRVLEEYNFDIVVMSNARKFSHESYTKKFANISNLTVTTTFFSIYPKVHDFVTGVRGSFFETLKGLKNLENLGINIIPKVLITRINYRHLPMFADFFSKHFESVKEVRVGTLDIVGNAERYKNIFAIKFSEIAKYVNKLLTELIDLGYRVLIRTIPKCLIDKSLWKHFSQDRKDYSLLLDPLRECSSPKPHITSKCDYCKLSCNIWDSYIKFYGDEEFKPIGGKNVRIKSHIQKC